ncbi:hypothetical protein Cgig2_008692 [Carnegiea gigantea]|uniref:Uncharacterized protein n=1 Tax=Carnegiea gigantea TaxID=171969 RepID=A0A9Q1JHL5_9CARY|nr:hypothetical protein Cgig2_008692 [Carnegiea gigantea]
MQRSDCESEGHLSPSSNHSGSGSGGGGGGGGDGENGGANEMGASYSSRPSTDYFTDRGRGVTLDDDRRRRRSPNEQPREPTQTYRRLRKVQQILIAPHRLILQMSHNLLDLIQVDNIEITLRSSTRGLLITRIIIIIILPFLASIQLQVSNLGWIQQYH